MSIKCSYFTGHVAGIRQTEEVLDTGHPYFTFYDVLLAPNQPVDAKEDAIQIIDKALQEKLTGEYFSEEKLIQAIDYANKKFLDASSGKNNAVSILIICKSPKKDELLVAGVGDCRVYAAQISFSKLIFSDPYNCFRENHTSSQDRLKNLKNALGRSDNLKVHVRTFQREPFERLLAVSYGVYTQIFEKEFQALAFQLNDPRLGALKQLTTCSQKEHEIKTCVISFEEEANTQISTSVKAELDGLKKRYKYTVASFLILAIVCALVLIFQMTNHPKISAIKEKSWGVFSLRKPEKMLVDANLNHNLLANETEEQVKSLIEKNAYQKNLLEEKDTLIMNLQEKILTLKKLLEEDHKDLDYNNILKNDEETKFTYSGEERTHTVQTGETLSTISKQYYGTAKKASIIFEANKNKLKDQNQIKVGMKLFIP